ncbi:ChbG/HpnK family deacetylase [bacterium]|nr:ChbG/HpnK family deacetylase [bacterium]MBU1025977.1 ChbG/HpnK family deacetylase [bacterium]
MTKKLIVNADDYGLVSSVSEGIIHSHLNGIVTSTTALINIASDADISRLKSISTLNAGVHLALTAGQSTLSKNKIPNLVDDGNFFRRKSKNRPVDDYGTLVFENVPEDEIRREFESQIEKFSAKGLRPSHLDTHHHIHANEKILDAVISVAIEYNLPVRSINQEMRDKIRSAGVGTNDFFTGNFFGMKNINPQNLMLILSEPGDGITELMCHPGFLSDQLKQVSGYSKERPIEMEVLTGDRLLESISTMNFELISWLDVML